MSEKQIPGGVPQDLAALAARVTALEALVAALKTQVTAAAAEAAAAVQQLTTHEAEDRGW